MSCSRKSGLPPAASATCRCAAGGRRSPPSIASSDALAAPDSRCRLSTSPRRTRSPARSCRSGRATHTTSRGASRSRATRSSSRSSSAGSAQWASSTTSASGALRVSPSTSCLNAQSVSSPGSPSSSPTAAATRRTATAGMPSSPAAPSASSCAIASRSGHSVMPSPYSRQRPAMTRPSAPAIGCNSATSRDLPMPGSPRIVSSSGARRSATRANVARRTSRSRSRPSRG